jgi:threonine dehydrogenase-like Zn-dependent dehydrogenase
MCRQFAIRSTFLLGAGRVIGIDRFPERLRMAEEGGAETINYEESGDVLDALKELTQGRGPDACIDAVGMEAHDTGIAYAYDKAKQAMRLETDRPTQERRLHQSRAAALGGCAVGTHPAGPVLGQPGALSPPTQPPVLDAVKHPARIRLIAYIRASQFVGNEYSHTVR